MPLPLAKHPRVSVIVTMGREVVARAEALESDRSLSPSWAETPHSAAPGEEREPHALRAIWDLGCPGRLSPRTIAGVFL